VVAWLGAVQAQDPDAARWAVGVRLRGPARGGDVDAALAAGTIVRTHALRGTWQLVAREDVRWLLGLVAPHALARSAPRFRELGLDAATFRRSGAAIQRSLEAHGRLTRAELGVALSRAGVATTGQRLPHLLQRAELDRLVCALDTRSRQPTYALLDAIAPASRARERDDALAELARRYFRSHGPASARDLAWWSGLPAADVVRAIELAGEGLVAEIVAGRTLFASREAPPPDPAARRGVHLLPAFDEYLVGYRDRADVLSPEHARQANPRGGMLDPCVVIGGRLAGTWRRAVARATVEIEVAWFEEPTETLRAAIARAARSYGAFLGREASLVSVPGRRRA
jgi:hypothetical protein